MFIILIEAVFSQIYISKFTRFVKLNTLNMFSLLYVSGISIKMFIKKTGAIDIEDMKIIMKNYKI